MKQQPLISIITVVYNGDKYLEQTIQSVINQTYKHIEYIIIDGGSTDGTLDLIKKYEKHITYWVSEPDKGLYDAMNKGIGIAKGELIGMINSDDWYELDAVEIMVKTYIENPTKNIFHSDRFDIPQNGQKKIRKFNRSNFKFKYYGMTYNHPGMFVTKKEYSEHLYKIQYKSHGDYNFVFEAYSKDRTKLYYVNEVIVNFRLGGISGNMNFIEASKDVFTIRYQNGLSIAECIFAFLLMKFVVLKTFLTK